MHANCSRLIVTACYAISNLTWAYGKVARTSISLTYDEGDMQSQTVYVFSAPMWHSFSGSVVRTSDWDSEDPGGWISAYSLLQWRKNSLK